MKDTLNHFNDHADHSETLQKYGFSYISVCNEHSFDHDGIPCGGRVTMSHYKHPRGYIAHVTSVSHLKGASVNSHTHTTVNCPCAVVVHFSKPVNLDFYLKALTGER